MHWEDAFRQRAAEQDGALGREQIHELGSDWRVARILRACSEARPPGSSPTESRNEDRFEKILADAGTDAMDRQVYVGGARPIGRVDFRDPSMPLVAEVNSLTFHSTPSDRRADERRYAELIAAAFGVAVIWEDDLWSHPSNVVDALREARRRVALGEPAAVHSAGCPWAFEADRIVVPRRIPGTRG